MNSEQSPAEIISYILVLFFGIGLHEYAHCKFADLAGDPTPRYFGRVTLNLFKHFEPVGTMMMVISAFVGFGIGWGRPAPMDPSKMRNPRWDWFVAVAAGPISNLCQAVIYASVLRLLLAHPSLAGNQDVFRNVALFLFAGVTVNISLCFFNLIPFGPLDGHWLLGLLLPETARLKWFLFNNRVGFTGVFILVIAMRYVPPLQAAIFAPVHAIDRLLLGM